MKRFFAFDIPPRAAAVVVALVLLASVVTGGEERRSPEAAQPPSPRSSEPQAALPDLELEKLVRQRSGQNVQDLFESSSWTLPQALALPPPPTVAPPPPPPPPPTAAVAPPLPFTYLGRMVKSERTLAYLLRGEEMLLVEAGRTFGDYRVEGITDAAVHFLYLPLGEKQTLRFPARE